MLVGTLLFQIDQQFPLIEVDFLFQGRLGFGCWAILGLMVIVSCWLKRTWLGILNVTLPDAVHLLGRHRTNLPFLAPAHSGASLHDTCRLAATTRFLLALLGGL